MANCDQISSSRVRCRWITNADIVAVADLLKKGFGRQRSRKFWKQMLKTLEQYPRPAGIDNYGILLESDDRVVAALLMIYSTVEAGPESFVRCNFSSWYVEPKFRSFASLHVSRALKQKAVTFINISPAPHTWPILTAQGFTRYSSGLFVTMPLLSAAPAGAVSVLEADAAASDAVVDPSEVSLLHNHAEFGCVSVWCMTADGVHPFVFARRVVRGVVPCFQLVYCRDIADFVRFARPLGRYLALRGGPLVIVDANGPIPGLVGHYFDGVRPKFFKGPNPPRLGDLSYTEAAMFGI